MNEAQTIPAGEREPCTQCPAPGTVQMSTFGASAMPVADHTSARQPSLLSRYFIFLFTAALVYAGWRNHEWSYLTPEEGIGYALGIIGGTLLLLLLCYPVRKHARWARNLGAVRHWFRAHMLLGIIGPVCILYHCNFQPGSTNSNVALISMLIVACSGLVGRYFYIRIHYGLYGEKADLQHLCSDTAVAKAHMDRTFEVPPGLQARLQAFESMAITPVNGFLASLLRVLVIGISTHLWSWFVSGHVLRIAIRNAARKENWSRKQQRVELTGAKHHLYRYLDAVRKVAGFSFYERLFSLWHTLHLPLYVMLLISGTVHVYAVHLY